MEEMNTMEVMEQTAPAVVEKASKFPVKTVIGAVAAVGLIGTLVWKKLKKRKVAAAQDAPIEGELVEETK